MRDNPLVEKLADIEDAINSHPKATAEVYWRCKAAFMAGLERNGATDWSRSHSLTTKDVALIHEYLLAGAFVSAWYASQGDTTNRNLASNKYVGVVIVIFDLSLEDIFPSFSHYETIWRKAFANNGIGGEGASWFGCAVIGALILFAVVAGVWHELSK